jgi:hypothetical protein
MGRLPDARRAPRAICKQPNGENQLNSARMVKCRDMWGREVMDSHAVWR